MAGMGLAVRRVVGTANYPEYHGARLRSRQNEVVAGCRDDLRGAAIERPGVVRRLLLQITISLHAVVRHRFVCSETNR